MSPQAKKQTLTIAAIVAPLAASVGVWAATALADQRIQPVKTSLEVHLAETAAMRPQMHSYVEEERAAREKMNRKLDMLVEDCYRRGGCKGQ